MKLTIDTKLKQIVIEDSVSINELNSFIVKNGYNDYTIVSKEKIESDKLREWFNSPQKWQTDLLYNNKPSEIYCGDTNTLNTLMTVDTIIVDRPSGWNSEFVRTPAGKLTSDDISFGNFSKTNL